MKQATVVAQTKHREKASGNRSKAIAVLRLALMKVQDGNRRGGGAAIGLAERARAEQGNGAV
jgi:hypothetical protein